MKIQGILGKDICEKRNLTKTMWVSASVLDSAVWPRDLLVHRSSMSWLVRGSLLVVLALFSRYKKVFSMKQEGTRLEIACKHIPASGIPTVIKP
jgi:hypothetical protein